MVILTRRLGPYIHWLVCFASPADVVELQSHLKPNQIIDLQHVLCVPTAVTYDVPLSSGLVACADLTASSQELFRRLSPTRRNLVHQGERLGDRVRISKGSDRAWKDFLTLHRDFVGWKRYTSRPLTRSSLRKYRAVSDVIVAYLDGEPQVAHLLVRDETLGRVKLAFSASGRFRGGEAAKWSGAVNSHLHWKEFRWYQDAGFSVYDFGAGLGYGKSQLAKFKLSFGTAMETGGYGRMVGSLAAPIFAGLRLARRTR
jgi:hypothetical protein